LAKNTPLSNLYPARGFKVFKRLFQKFNHSTDRIMSIRFCLSYLFYLLIFSNIMAQTPRELAERISRRVVTDTKFEFQKQPVKWEQERVAILNFEVLPNFKKGKKWVVYSKIIRPKGGDTEGVLGLSADAGTVVIYLDDTKIFEKTIQTQRAEVVRIDYELLHFSENMGFKTTRDSSQLTIFYQPKTRFAKLYLSILEKKSGMTLTSWKFDKWGIEKQQTKKPIIAGWQGLDTFPTPSVSTLEKGNQNTADWRYYNGTLAIAMHDTWLHFGLDNLKPFLKNHVRFFMDNVLIINAERKKYGLIDSPFSLYFRGKLLDDLGMQTAALALSNTYTNRDSKLFERQKALITEGVEKIKTRVPTLPDGTFTRLTPDSLTVQSDDLMMGGYAFLRMGLAERNGDYIKTAAEQSLNFHKYLFDPSSNLYRHAFSTKTGQQSCCSWGRGMGWMLLVNTDLLKKWGEKVDNTPPQYKAEILKNFQVSCAALLKYQAKNGGFHQILTDTTTYLETSATAMFVYAFAEGVNNGWLPKADYEAAILKGWNFLKTQIQADGTVKNIVRGTPILPTAKAYNQQKTNVSDPRGLGAVLWACAAMDRFLK
jgi:unsaturated rhamnogalacturonyl hydrolase